MGDEAPMQFWRDCRLSLRLPGDLRLLRPPRLARRVPWRSSAGFIIISCRQTDPELEAPHAALRLLRHLRMNDAASSGHALHVAWCQVAAVAGIVLVTHLAFQHGSDILENAMGCDGKPRI